ncbi:2-dehydro-3-deoxy-D-gluconate 5-dehydrogenase KduD [Treponema sp. HNW]|uniref:2-dehydro-3-deoxy-D-gluconate 5-dehydrogenase KduD n=1 Tax=Treponema sp. HNW TaxID=3116654 RepID=UPI003D0BA9F5
MILDDFKLTGKVAIVTGCNTGLGQGMACALAEAGADIFGVYRSTPGETPAMIRKCGGRFEGIQADLSVPANAENIINQAVNTYKHIDILVNNAGIIRREDSIAFSEKDWDDVLNTNLKSLFFLSQAAAKHFIAQNSGRIINIASMLSYQGGIRVPSYTASKSAVKGLTMTLANEWAQHGITVNAIAPGYIETNNTVALRADEKRNAAILERIPAGRWGTPDDIKGAVVFLASKAAEYINGFTLAVDGGWLAR